MFVLAFAAEAAMVTTSTPKETRVQRAKQANSWQNRLDKALLDVDAAPKARVRLLQRALKDRALQKDVKLAAEEIREKGMGKGHVLAIDLLFPTGTTARSDLDGLLALRKQVPELLQQSPPTPAQLQELLASAPPPDPLVGFKIAGELAGLATDQAKRQAVLDEAKNALRATPKGLEAPRYPHLNPNPNPNPSSNPNPSPSPNPNPRRRATVSCVRGRAASCASTTRTRWRRPR